MEHESSSGSPASSPLTNTTEQLFRIWVENCLQLQGQQKQPVVESDTSKTLKKVAEIQHEARTFFTSLVQGTTVHIGETVLQTRASHGDALALLIRTLEPCFAATASLAVRWAALSCFTGSIQGCCCGTAGVTSHSLQSPSPGGSGGIGGTLSSSSIQLVQLLGTFLLQHAGPIAVDSATGDDFDEEIRDAAQVGLTALLQCTPAAITTTTLPPSFMPKSISSGLTGGSVSNDASTEWLKWRLTIAQAGVERRCAQDDDDDDDDRENDDMENGDYDNYRRSTAASSGLSLLPRSRRSLCFDLIRAAVDAVAMSAVTPHPRKKHSQLYDDADHLPQLDATTLSIMTKFCKFVASCLHGESDPRCLLQLLQLFDAVLTSFQQFGQQQRKFFPVLEFFDAVAPYYPIQFNPPPNDAHGITRAALRQAVLRVLSCTFYDHDHDNCMASLSCGILLESLVPPPEDGPLTFKEQIEALEDLQTFLFATQGIDKETNCDKANAEEIKHIADACLTVHEASCLTVSRRGDDAVTAKTLADLCRVVVARVAVATERRSSKDAWQVFVELPVRKLSARLEYSSMSDRVAIAYMACLASSGGAKTLRVCLETGLVSLLKCLESGSTEDEEAATAVYGIGAFFSSCRAAVENAARDGIQLHPHPLQPYITVALDRIYEILKPGIVMAPSLRVAAVRALESILLASPADLFAEDRIDRIVVVLRCISLQLLDRGSAANETTVGEDEAELLAANSLTLGVLLGRALDVVDDCENTPDNNNATPAYVLEAAQVRRFLQDDFFATLLASAKIRSKNKSTTPRREQMTLSYAASFSLTAASKVVKSLAQSLQKALHAADDDTAIAIAETLSFLFEQREQLAAIAYQGLTSPDVTALDIMSLLSPIVRGKDEGMEADFGMSNLLLPQTTEDFKRNNLIIVNAYEIIRLLRKGYEIGVTDNRFEELVTTVDQVLPPLSDADIIQLSIALPFLSAAMESVDPGANYANVGGKSTSETLRGMAGDLADFAMTSENFAGARAHAARCLHAAISRFTPRNAQECPARDLAQHKVMPSLKSSLDEASKINQNTKARAAAVASFRDSLNVLALLGSAAACRGGPSLKTSDQIVLCLVDLACTKKTDFLFADDIQGSIDLSVFDTRDCDDSTWLSIGAAAAFGSILSTECGKNLLWKQRLSHVSMKRILERINISQQGIDSTKYDSLGLLTTVCHLLCLSDLHNFTATNLESIANVIANGLSLSNLQAAARADASVSMLVLAALVKLLCVSPSSLKHSIYRLVTGTMRAYAVADELEHRAEVANKILALQALEVVTHMGHSPEVLRTVKPAVVSLLGAATDHPSGVLRLAAVEVRNAWFVVE